MRIVCSLILLWFWLYTIRRLTTKTVDPAVVRSMTGRIVVGIDVNILGVIVSTYIIRLGPLVFIMCLFFIFLTPMSIGVGVAFEKRDDVSLCPIDGLRYRSRLSHHVIVLVTKSLASC